MISAIFLLGCASTEPKTVITTGGELTEEERAYCESLLEIDPAYIPIASEYEYREGQYQMFSPSPVDIVFIGDSITAEMKTGDMFDVRTYNRGIGGDTIRGVTVRLPTVAKMSPKRVFFLVGINDLPGGQISGEDGFGSKYYELFEQISKQMPDAEVFIQSVLPTDPNRRPDLLNEYIREINKMLQGLCDMFGYHFIDVYSAMSDAKQNMIPAYSRDGLHLSPEGMLKWSECVHPYVSQKRSPEIVSQKKTVIDMANEKNIITKEATFSIFQEEILGTDRLCHSLSWTATDGFGWEYVGKLKDGKITDIYDIISLFHNEDAEQYALLPQTADAEDNDIVLIKIDDSETVVSQPLLFN